MSLNHVASRMFNTPLLLDEAKAGVMARSYAPAVLGNNIILDEIIPLAGELTKELNRIQMRDGRKYAAPHIEKNVAIIEIEGSLVHKGSYIGKSSGVMSYQGISAQVEECLSDVGRLRAAVFEVDSFGGEVSGAFALAEKMHQLSQRIPTFAILTDHALSAGYLLASACSHIIAPATGYVGSIGVITMHLDMSQKLANEGLQVTVIRAGAKKAKPTQFEAMTDVEFNERTTELEELRSEFAALVSGFRGDRFSQADGLATEAAHFRAGDGLKLGLIDAVENPEIALQQILAEFN